MDSICCEECGKRLYGSAVEYRLCFGCYIESLDVAIDGE